MTEMHIHRPLLSFEREFGQHRNWWVRDFRLTGNPLSVLLYSLSHEPGRPVTQEEAQRDLGLGKDAWASAKRRLIEAGFLVEVRDRWPAGATDNSGRACGGQKRFRLVLQDPEPETVVLYEDAVFEVNFPFEGTTAEIRDAHCGLSALVDKSTADNPHRIGKGQVRATADYPQWDPASADNPQSLREEKKGQVLKSQVNKIHHLTDPTDNAREDSVDEALERLAPGCNLTVKAITAEVEGRVDLSQVDLVAATKDTLLRASGPVRRPAAYVASVLVQKPESWKRGSATFLGDLSQAYATSPEAPAGDSCMTGVHDWGSMLWPEKDRAYCVTCSVPRRSVSPEYEAWEREFTQANGGGF